MTFVPDTHNLARFVDAQSACYESVLRELRNGKKTSHWIWYVFPQIDGLAFSSTSRHYAIKTPEEAQAYMQHPLLGERLVECTQLVIDVEGKDIVQMLGHTDALKFRSSMTLFDETSSVSKIFTAAIEKYYDGIRDDRTLQLLRDVRGR